MGTVATVGAGILVAGGVLVFMGPWGPCGPASIPGLLGEAAILAGLIILGIRFFGGSKKAA